MYKEPVSNEIVAKTADNLRKRGIESYIAESKEEAVKKIFELIPEKSQVMTMTSITLETLGVAEILNTSGKYDSVRKRFETLDPKKDWGLMRALGAAPEYTTGSVHAITEDGEIFIASKTGSQLPAYAFGANKVIFAVGVQKIVKDKEMALKRIYDYVLPLESERANKAYNITTGSSVNKLLTIEEEITPGRITVVFIPESIGF